MNKRRFYKELENIKSIFDDDNMLAIKSLCEELSDATNKNNKFTFNLLMENPESQKLRSALSSAIQIKIASERQSINFKKVILDFYWAEESIKKITSQIEIHPIVSENLSKTMELLDTFTSKYNDYRANNSPQYFLDLSYCATEVKYIISKTEYAIDCLLSLKNLDVNPENTQPLELYLSNVPSLTLFGRKLESIDIIYNEISNLLNISISDNPVVIQHIENGSLWLKIAGNSATVAILTTIINYASSYYINSYTTKGQIEELSGTISSINEVIKLSDELQKHGVDTTEMNDHINTASKKIAKKLDLLLNDQPSIEVNDKKHNVGDKFKDKLIEQSRTKLINYSDTEL